MSRKRIALLDGDMFAFKVAFASMNEIMFDEYVISVGDTAEAKQALDNWIHSVKEQVGADEVVVAFTNKLNFRKDIFPEYKANRVGKPRPHLVKILREYCEQTYKTAALDGLEADDLLGILGTKSYFGGDEHPEIINVSMDKDISVIPGASFNPDKDTMIQWADPIDALQAFYIQTLTGDAADNYKGCPGIGKVKAAKYIQEARDAATINGHLEIFTFLELGWDAIVKCFEKSYLTKEDAIVQAQMAKILWCFDWDEKRKRVIPWTISSFLDNKDFYKAITKWRQR